MKAVLIVVSLLGVFACAQEVMEAGRDIPETDRDINEVEDARLFHFDYSKQAKCLQRLAGLNDVLSLRLSTSNIGAIPGHLPSLHCT